MLHAANGLVNHHTHQIHSLPEVVSVGTDWKRIQLLVTPDMVTLIDEWRRRQPDLPDRNEAIRTLLARGLAAEGVQPPEEEAGR